MYFANRQLLSELDYVLENENESRGEHVCDMRVTDMFPVCGRAVCNNREMLCTRLLLHLFSEGFAARDTVGAQMVCSF